MVSEEKASTFCWALVVISLGSSGRGGKEAAVSDWMRGAAALS